MLATAIEIVQQFEEAEKIAKDLGERTMLTHTEPHLKVLAANSDNEDNVDEEEYTAAVKLRSALGAGSQKVSEVVETFSAPSPVYPSVSFQVLNVDHIFLRQDSPKPAGNSSLRARTETFVITGPGAGLLQPTVNASYGPLMLDASIPLDLLLSGRRILPVLLSHQIRSSSPVVWILFHMPSESNITAGWDAVSSKGDDGRRTGGSKVKDGAHCVTAYAFWETKEVRGSCLVSPGEFCVAQLKPESAWFSSASRSSSREGTEGVWGVQGNPVEVYFQSRRDPMGQCVPQDSLQRVGVGSGRDSGGSGTPLRRIGRIGLIKAPPGNPTFLRLRLGGTVVIQTSSKPLKTSEVATFYIFLASTSTLETFMLRAVVKTGLTFSAAWPSDSSVWDIVVEPSRRATANMVTVKCSRKSTNTPKRGLVEVFQLDFVPQNISEVQTQTVSWRLQLPGNMKEDVGIMRIYISHREFLGLAPLAMSSDILNTALLTGKMVSVPVKVLAVEVDGSITDVTNMSSCRSMEEDIIKVSERCDYVFVDGTESRGKVGVMVNFTYSFLNAQLEMNVWLPRLPLTIDINDPELSQIKGWRVPVTVGNRRSVWDSDEEEEMRKGRGCMLQYQRSTMVVKTPFIAQSNAELPLLTGDTPEEFFLGPDWQVDVTTLVQYSMVVADPDVAWIVDGVVLQGRAVGTTAVQVVSPLSSSILAQRTIRVLDDKISMTELGIRLVSGLSLSLQLSPDSNRAIVATATMKETITQLKQEAVVSCWVSFSDGAVMPLELFDRSVYSLTVSTPDERVATVRRTPQSTFVVAQSESSGQGVLVRAELRICEECQKSKRKSKLVVGSGFLKINIQNQSRTAAGRKKDPGGWSSAEVVNEVKMTMRPQSTGSVRTTNQVTTTSSSTVSPTKQVQPHAVWIETTTEASKVTNSPVMTSTKLTPKTLLSTTIPKETTAGQKRSYANMVDNKDAPKADTSPKKDPPRPKPPRLIEGDLIQTFRAMSNMEIGMYALVGVPFIIIIAFFVHCALYNLCCRNHKTLIQTGPAPPNTNNTKEHKHDWVWMGGANQTAAAAEPPAQVSTLKQDPHRQLESCHSVDSALPTVSANATTAAIPERTATLGRSRNSFQHGTFPRKSADIPMNRSATLLPRSHRSEPLHSPTSKRNQVQFTTFTTLDIKHLAALKKNGVDLNWTNQQAVNQQSATPPQTPLPDMPWPVVKPLGEPQ
ncbi:transmembrane protein 132D-like [Pholidichthys leucotaenia]